MTGSNGLAHAVGIASFWIRRGIADCVEILHQQRLVLTISRFDVRELDEPRRQDTYQVRTLDQQHALICLGHAAQWRDALILADEQLLSHSAPVAVEVRRGDCTVGNLTHADRGRVWPQRGVRRSTADTDVTPDKPPPRSSD